MNGYFVTVSNNLLEDKHFEKMGGAVWLYMWLIDKMTEISEGLGIVSYGNPVTIDDVRENFAGMSDRTYHRMVAKLRQGGYINTVQAKYGLYITVNKPKKYFGNQTSPAKNGRVRKQALPKMSPALPNVADSPAKNGIALYIDNNTTNNTFTNNSTDVELGEKKSPAKNTHRENVSKLYYEAVKALDLPVRNHNNVKAKIAELGRDADHEKIVNYLVFMRDQFASVDWEFKPHISEALDIFNKRGTIRDTFKKHVTATKEQSTAWKPRGKTQ